MRKKSLALIVLLFFTCSIPVVHAANSLRGNIFLEMMLAMMDFMGMIDRDRSYYNQPYPNFNHYPQQGLSTFSNPWQSSLQSLAWQQMLAGGYPGLPGAGGFMPGNTIAPLSGLGGWSSWANPSNMPGGMSNPQSAIPYLPEYFNLQQPGSFPGNPVYQTHWIEGRWLANDNMIMEVQQGQFVMYYRDRPDQVRGGLIRLKDNYLAIYEKTHQIVRQYEYAYKNERLVLRDADGNMMLFKRMTDWPIPVQ